MWQSVMRGKGWTGKDTQAINDQDIMQISKWISQNVMRPLSVLLKLEWPPIYRNKQGTETSKARDLLSLRSRSYVNGAAWNTLPYQI